MLTNFPKAYFSDIAINFKKARLTPLIAYASFELFKPTKFHEISLLSQIFSLTNIALIKIIILQ